MNALGKGFAGFHRFVLVLHPRVLLPQFHVRPLAGTA